MASNLMPIDLFSSAKSLSAADKANLFTERMSSTAHQREVADLKAAGLNPVLSADSSGATTGSAAQDEEGSYSNPVYNLINNINKVTNNTAKTYAAAVDNLNKTVKQSLKVTNKAVEKMDESNLRSSSYPEKSSDSSSSTEKTAEELAKEFVQLAVKRNITQKDVSSSIGSALSNLSDKKSESKLKKLFDKLVPKAEYNEKTGKYKVNTNTGYSKIPVLGAAWNSLVSDLTQYTGRDVGTAIGSPFLSPIITVARNLLK